MKSPKTAIGLVFIILIASIWILKPRHTTALPTSSADDASTLLAKANRLSWLGNWHAAAPLYQIAEDRFHLAGNRKDESYARVGRIRAQAGETPVAQTLAAFASELDRIETMHDSRLKMWCLAMRGSVAIDADSSLARRDWVEVLQLANQLHELQWAARADGELGVFAFLDGDTAAAVSLVGRSILSAYRSGDVGSQIHLLSMLGYGFNEEKRYAEALSMFKRAIATAESTPDAGFSYLAYKGEAAALSGLHQDQLASQVLKNAISIARTQDDFVHESELLLQAGQSEREQNAIPEAENSIRAALRSAERLGVNRTVEQALFDLADVERRLGRPQNASNALKYGLKVSKRLGDTYYLPRDLTALAELKAAENKTREADKLFERAEDALDRILVNQHSFEENTARSGAMSPTYLGHFRLAIQMKDTARAFQVLERVRGRIVASQLFVRERSGPKSPRITDLEGEIAATQIALLHNDSATNRSALMEQLLADERKLAFELNEAGLRRRDLLAKPISLKSIQSMLREDEVLVEYVVDEPKALCIAVTTYSARLFTLPAGAGTIRELTQSYLAELKSRRSGEQFATELYRILLQPILKVTQHVRIVVSPDDILNMLPFETLRDGNGYIIRSRIISYTPSGTVLWQLRTSKFIESVRPLLAVGAVDYRLARVLPKTYAHDSVAVVAVRGLAELSGSKLEDLPASRDEVLAIAKTAGPNSTVLLGQKATETEFKAQKLADFRVIHLATHATADPQYPDRAALVLGVAPNSADDGLLQVREIMHLHLNADLVTLSACDTDVGTNQGEAGVVNLEQAFLIAGARAVVASLWKVEDSSTTTLMTAFYSHLAQHEDKALALAHAKRDILEKYGDTSPYYWAPFVMIGEGSEEVSFGK